MDVEEQLRGYLRRSKLTPKQIGEAAGVEFASIYRFQEGRSLRSDTFARLCTWLGVRLTERSPGEPVEEHPVDLDRHVLGEVRRHLEGALAGLESLDRDASWSPSRPQA